MILQFIQGLGDPPNQSLLSIFWASLAAIPWLGQLATSDPKAHSNKISAELGGMWEAVAVVESAWHWGWLKINEETESHMTMSSFLCFKQGLNDIIHTLYLNTSFYVTIFLWIIVYLLILLYVYIYIISSSNWWSLGHQVIKWGSENPGDSPLDYGGS